MDIEGGKSGPPMPLISVHGAGRWRECTVVLASAGYTLLDLHGMPARLDAAGDDLVALPAERVDETLGRGRWPSSNQAGSI